MSRSQYFSHSSISRIVLLCLLIFSSERIARAQSTAVLNGTVTDASGATAPNAKVVITNVATDVVRTTQTDQAGAYLIPALPPGVYRLEISAPGFQTYIIADLRLGVATTATQNVQLKVGQVAQEVVVNIGAPLVDTTTSSVSQVVDSKTVQEIPLNGRHFVDLSLLVPGTVVPPQNGFLAVPLQGLGSLGIDTAGQRETTTNWLVNGINLNDEVNNQVTFQPAIDTVAEFKIDNSTFPAEYGRNSGAIVNIATRSGSNAFHGEAFDFLRNNYFDARNFFNASPNPQSPLNRNDFGGDVGGPVLKNKFFFFGSYEGLRQHHALTLDSPVPAGGSTSASPAVNALLALLPQPNSTIGGLPSFAGSTGAPVNVDIGTGDLSYIFNQKDSLHAYYAIEKDHRFEPTASNQGPFFTANVPGFGDTRDGTRQLLTLSEDHIFSPSLTNQLRLGFNRIFITFEPNTLTDPASLGINLPAGVPASGLPVITILDLGLQFGGPVADPEGRGDTTVVLNDTLSWLKSRNSFAFGGEVRRFYNNNISENIGSFTYSTLADFLADDAKSYSTLSGNGNDKILAPSWGLFAQDGFKLKPNFTINIGLRYDYNSTPSESGNRLSVFDPTTGSLVQVGSQSGFGQVYGTNNLNFQPRIGFAWDPFRDGKTSVRGGYALMTQQPTTDIIANLSQNPPFATQFASNAGGITLEAPPTTLAGVSPFTVDPHLKNAYAQDWNLTIQRQLSNSMAVQIAYIGSKGTHLQQERDLNQPTVVNGLFQTTVPYPQFNQIFDFTSNGVSSYNALWVTLNKKIAHGLEFTASYTYSKSLDNASLDVPNNLPQDANNLGGEYGPSDFDARHRFVFSGFYQLPFKGNRLVSGWQLGIITQAQSGNPLTVLFFPNNTLTLRPNISAPLQVTGDPNNWIANPQVLSSPCDPATQTICSPGNLGRNTVIGPKFVNTDFSLIKNTKIREALNLQFRVEAFDLFNHPSFGDPNLTFVPDATGGLAAGSGFGLISNTRFPTGDFGSSRQLQLALKLEF